MKAEESHSPCVCPEQTCEIKDRETKDGGKTHEHQQNQPEHLNICPIVRFRKYGSKHTEFPL